MVENHLTIGGGGGGQAKAFFWRVSLKQGIYFRIFLSKAESGFQVLSSSPIPKYWSGKKQNTDNGDKHIQLTHFYKLDVSHDGDSTHTEPQVYKNE